MCTLNKGNKSGTKRSKRILTERATNDRNSPIREDERVGNELPKTPARKSNNVSEPKATGVKRTRASDKLSESTTVVVDTDSKRPVYQTDGETPLKRVSLMSVSSAEDKLREYEFEPDDKNENTPKRKRKPVMKIQRVRTYVRKKSRVAKENSDIPPLIQKMLLSTPMKAESEKIETGENKNRLPRRTLYDDDKDKTFSITGKQATPSAPLEPASPSFDVIDCPLSPIPSVGNENARTPFHIVRLPVRNFGPITNSSTPNYVTSSTPRYSYNNLKKMNLLANMSANTPIKYHCEVSDFSLYDPDDEPRKFDVDNCFGFDEWDVDDPQRIKMNCPPPPPPTLPKPAVLPNAPTVHATEVIKLLESSLVPWKVGPIPSLYDTCGETTLEDTSLERMFKKTTVPEATSFVSEDPVTERDNACPSARKARKSYERINKTPRRLHWNGFVQEQEEDSDEHELEDPTSEPQNKKAKKRENVMTKKEEEEFEKWASMFNEQCKEIEKYPLCVE